MRKPITMRWLLNTNFDEEVREAAMRGLASRPNGYVVAVDFDGFLCKDAWPDIGKANPQRIEDVKKIKEIGAKVILWTCRENGKLFDALDWCALQGLTFDGVNENIPERVKQYGSDPRKIGYDELWDDKAVPADLCTGLFPMGGQ